MMIRMVNNEHGNDDDDYECIMRGLNEWTMSALVGMSGGSWSWMK